MISNPAVSLWVNSPCTLAYTSHILPLEKSKRFHFNSIYYRHDASQPIKRDEQLRKPELMVSEFRRNLKQVDNSLRRKSAIKKIASIRTKKLKTAEKMNRTARSEKENEIIERLCPAEEKLIKMEYDLYGNRSSFFDTTGQSIAKIKKRKKLSNRKIESHFSDSTRIDISKPENFNPGPGSYFLDDYSHSKFVQCRSEKMKKFMKSKQSSSLSYKQESSHNLNMTKKSLGSALR